MSDRICRREVSVSVGVAKQIVAIGSAGKGG